MRFSGIYPMMYTFFNSDGSLDEGAIRSEVELSIANGVDGISVLGIAGEVFRLDVEERRRLVELIGQTIAGRCRYAVTIAEPNARGQTEFMRVAAAWGADWVILQLPSVRGATEADLVGFLRDVAKTASLPVAIQNNPFNMDVAISNESLLDLHRADANISIMKAEAAAVSVETLARVETLSVFSGRNGVEIISSLRSGCVGSVPAPEVALHLKRIFNLMRTGAAEDERAAEDLYRMILPLIVFVGQGLPTQICYGKQLVGDQLGLSAIHLRGPALRPTVFGLETVRRLHRDIAS